MKYRSNAKIISIGLLKKIGIRANLTEREITVENGDHVNCNGVVKDVTVSFDNLTTTIIPAARGGPVDLLIEISKLERLQTNLVLGGNFAEIKTIGEEVRVALQPKTGSFNENGNSVDKDFTTNLSSDTEEVSITEFNAKDEMVISLGKEIETDCESQAEKTLNFAKIEVVKIKLSHLLQSTAEEIYSNFDRSGIFGVEFT